MSDAMNQPDYQATFDMNQLIEYLRGGDELSLECMKDDPKKEINRRLDVARENIVIYANMLAAYKQADFAGVHGELLQEKAIVLNLLLQYLYYTRLYAALHETYSNTFHEFEKFKIQVAEEKMGTAVTLTQSAKALDNAKIRIVELETQCELLITQLRKSWRHRIAAWLLGVKK